MTSKYLIVADDFTGANDSGVQMKNRGLPIDVTLFPKEEKIKSSLVLDTESRNISGNDAYAKVKKMSETILNVNEFDLVYKKVDSTLRGNIIDELKALNDVYQADKIVFAPAFPKINRTTQDGIHRLNGIPLMETEFAKDPLSPILKDNITELLEEGFNDTVKHHPVGDEVTLDGAKYHTFDAVKESDLLTIVSGLLNSSYSILWVGSAGLANALFQTMYPLKPALAVVGSISENSLRQMQYAEQEGIEVLQIGVNDLFDKEQVMPIAAKAKELLNAKGKLILTAAKNRSDYEKTIKHATELGMSKDDCSWYVQKFLSDVTSNLLENIDLSGMFLTGGATAISVMDAINTTRVSIESELLTGTVYSTLSDGPHEGLNIVTKAGAFGEREDLLYCLEKIREM